jgi:hypothetical protein
MEPNTKPRRGRPPVERRRIPMGLRVTPELSDQLVARASETGRSITQQLEFLLEEALFIERAMGSKAWRVAYDIMIQLSGTGSRAAKWAGISEPEPLDNPTTYALGMIHAVEALAAHYPGNPTAEDIDAVLNAAREQIKEKLRERDSDEEGKG